MENYRVCMCFTRKFKINEVQIPMGVKAAFARFTGDGSLMTADQLLRFLIEFQGEGEARISDAERIIQRTMQRRHHIEQFAGHALSLDDFHHFLFCDELNSPIRTWVHQDMGAPLSHYFIFTGHNSYLTGNQLSSDCSDVPIIKALKRGVRVIELDLWPNSTKDEVLVLHGGTLTTPVALIKCLKSIKEYAFCSSPYPVVITLEDHLTPDLQAKVAKMATQTFGEMLFCTQTESLEEFPSPEALKYKIIISSKPPKEYLEANKGVEEKDKLLYEEDGWEKDFLDIGSDDKSESDWSEYSHDDEDVNDFDHNLHQVRAPEYKSLIAIHARKRKGGVRASLIEDPKKVGRLSLSEQSLAKAAKRHGTDLVRFTQRNLLRVYPKGTRFNSSNYSPLIGWTHGAQMVAFNMQGYGRSLWLMQGMFRSNGGCGYVKKPDILLERWPHNQVFAPKMMFPVKKTLKVSIYMGDGWNLDFNRTYFDAYSPPDFYCKVGIAGVPADSKMRKTETKDDEWTPVWDAEFWFPLTVPELALLRIEVFEYDVSEKDDFGGQTCLPVWELKPGIRAVPLYSHKGEKFESVRLLVQFQFV
ncbi:hypothetical protein Sjap_014102 [Stephania japonica]|uniref:Phosphoinositide phospholipase C n=1 Tax=Stephania japonica TaxID=461633 RepID=A0AAP0J0H1_9MAGN